jgi:REP element-mobilizing transposase RayT
VWNDTEIPLAFFITFRSYGTWLHGDERGSIDRFHNAYKSPYLPENQFWRENNASKLKNAPVKLDAQMRRLVSDAIRDCCVQRKWELLALNPRTNHVHSVVVTGAMRGEPALNAFKGNATRFLREGGAWTSERTPWARKGSCRSLWNERSVANAVDYVINGQGGDLPDFD